MAEFFYPNRTADFTTDLENIQINNRNPDAQYVLDMDSRYLNSFNALENMQEVTGDKCLNIDDIPNFIKMVKGAQKRLNQNQNNTTNFDNQSQFNEEPEESGEDYIDLDDF